MNDTLTCDLFHFLAPVWNRRYVDRFLQLGLPSLLSANNVGSVPAEKSLFHIFTTRMDYPAFQECRSFGRLKELVPVQVDFIDDFVANAKSNTYQRMSQAYEQGLTQSMHRDAAFFFLTADAVWSDGCVARSVEHLRRGKRAVMTAGLQMWDLFAGKRLHRYYDRDRQAISISPRQLIEVFLENPHPMHLAMFGETTNPIMSNYYWSLNRRAFVAHCFHLHPMVVRPRRRIPSAVHPTMDLGYVQRTVDFDDVHIVSDSDEMCVAGLSARHQYAWRKPTTVPLDTVTGWIRANCNSFHREYVKTCIYFHADDVPSDAGPVVEHAGKVINRFMAKIQEEEACLVSRLSRTLCWVAGGVTQKTFNRVVRWVKSLLRPSARLVHRALTSRVQARLEDLQRQIDELRAATMGAQVVPTAPGLPGEVRTIGDYTKVYRKIVDHLRDANIQGEVVEFGAGNGVRARLLAEAIHDTRLDVRIYVIDDYTRYGNTILADPEAWRGNDLRERIANSLCQVIPAGNVCVADCPLTDPLSPLKDVEKIACLQINGGSGASALNTLRLLAERDLIQEGCVIYFDAFNAPGERTGFEGRTVLQGFLNDNPRWNASPFVSSGWSDQAFFLSTRMVALERLELSEAS